MKKFTFLSLVTLALMTLTGCDAIGAIFEAGVWTGVIAIAAVVGLILWLFTRNRK
ncbi:hypothetical protein FIC_01165 [Flavobacteriaceae bacterium 3519-10]|nr:hypothetical protein FIC_01165 [Flavobacteriaceae bacterium 3519-10]